MSRPGLDLATHRRMVQALQKACDLPVCIETHSATLLLGDNEVYKLKKPVDLGFLDFSTCARRENACREELRLNRRTAHALYLGLRAIGGTPDTPCWLSEAEAANPGAVLDWAVHMRRFPAEAHSDAVLATLTTDAPARQRLFMQLATHIVALHAQAGVATAGDAYGTPERVWAPVGDTLAHLRDNPAVPRDAATQAVLADVSHWCATRFAALRPLIAARKAAGMVREGHGDLHLGNLIVLDGEPLLFDALEFDPALRWIDVAADIAFLFMDLAGRQPAGMAWEFLDAWLTASGDFDALPLLPFYAVYRALVRAKVAAIASAQHDEPAQRAEADTQCRHYLALATRLAAPATPRLLLVSGLSGSGKSHLAAQLLARHGCMRLRSDVERKRLFGLAAHARSHDLARNIYDADANARTSAQLLGLAEAVLTSGLPLIIDATLLRRAARRAFQDLAQRLGVPHALLLCTAPRDVLEARIRKREAQGNDPSEAGLAVLAGQFAQHEPPDTDEAAFTVTVATDQSIDWAALDTALSRVWALSA